MYIENSWMCRIFSGYLLFLRISHRDLGWVNIDSASTSTQKPEVFVNPRTGRRVGIVPDQPLGFLSQRQKSEKKRPVGGKARLAMG